MADRLVTQSAAEADRIGSSGPSAGPPWPSATTSRVGALIRRHQLERLLPADDVETAQQRGVLPGTGDRRLLTIMFVDIRGSSRIEETLSPERTIEFLNLYLGLAAQAILANEGSINKFIGDGILAVFGLLEESDRGAANALAAAGAIHRSFESASAHTSRSEQIRAVVALHTGTAIIGVIGLAERSDYAVLGSVVNIASRLEEEAKELNLRTVLSGSTVAALVEPPDSLHLVTRKALRGVSESIEIWTIDPTPAPAGLQDGHASPMEPAAVLEAQEFAGIKQPRWRPFAATAVAACTFFAVFATVMGLRFGGDQFQVRFVDSMAIVAALAAAAVCAWTAGRSAGRLRRGWGLVAASATAWSIGEATSMVYDQIIHMSQSSISIADAGFLTAIPLGIAGVLAFWTSPLGPMDQVRAWLDGLIVGISLVFAAWALGLNDVVQHAGSNFGEQATQILFPFGEIVIGTIVILVLNRGARYLKGPLLLVLAGVAASTIADIVSSRSEADGNGTLHAFAGTGWVVAFLLIALASRWPTRQRSVETEKLDLWQLALPWMAVLLAAISTLVVVFQGASLDRFLTSLTAVLAVSLAISQVFAHRDSLAMLVKSRLSEQTLAEVIARAPVGIARADTDLNIIDANPRLGALLRQPRELLLGSPITKYLPVGVHLQMRHRLADLASGVATAQDVEIPMIRADGSHGWAQLSATAISGGTGDVDYFLAMLQDTTARHEAEDRARAGLATLENLNRLKTQFLQSVGHEFKTALIGISGFSELILGATKLDPDEVREFARDISKDAERLGRLVTELLDLDRIETAQQNMCLDLLDMNDLIRREVEQIKAGTDGLVFILKLEPTLPVVAGDGAKLSQAIGTLLHHAVTFSRDGGQIVVTSRTHVGQVEVSVRDQGLGARADFDNPLFDQRDIFARNPIRKVVGTGLGLGIVRQIVAMHGGRIWIDQLEGIGSESHFTIPITLNLRIGETSVADDGGSGSHQAA
jgi:PAS domain S-box-containing protein